MDLVVIRHAIAEDRDQFAKTGNDDTKRPLSKRGRSRMRESVRGLERLVPQIDVLGTSPFTRAAQTARIVAGRFDGVKPVKVDALTPSGKRDDVLAWLAEQGEAETVAIVGHEPMLGLTASWLLASPLNHFLEFKQGGACLVQWEAAPSAGTAWLRWVLTPRQLRWIGRARS